MYLPELLKSVGKNYQRVHVKGICFDSRKAKKNDIFFAIEGNKHQEQNLSMKHYQKVHQQ